MEQEIWKPIKGFDGLYEVSNLGRLRSLEHRVTYSDGRVFNYPEKILSPTITPKGYYSIALTRDKRIKRFLVHRLIAEAFIPNPENKPQIDHIDTNKLNNSIANLRWTTQTENMNNAITVAHIKRVMKNGGTHKTVQSKKRDGIWIKPVYQFSLDGVKIAKYDSITDAANATGTSISAICMCCNPKRRNKRANGYMWSYSETIQPYISPYRAKCKRIALYDLNGNIERIFANIMEASEYVGTGKSGIYQCCLGYNKTFKGRVWRYVDDQL